MDGGDDCKDDNDQEIIIVLANFRICSTFSPSKPVLRSDRYFDVRQGSVLNAAAADKQITKFIHKSHIRPSEDEENYDAGCYSHRLKYF